MPKWNEKNQHLPAKIKPAFFKINRISNIHTCSPNWFCDFNGQNYSNFDGRK